MKFEFTITHDQDEFPLIVGGKLSAGEMGISDIHIGIDHIDSAIMAHYSFKDIPEREQSYRAKAILSDRGISYIEDVRQRHPKGDLKLRISIKGFRVRSHMQIASLHETEKTMEFADGQREGHLMAYDQDSNINPSRRDNWFLAARDATPLSVDGLSFQESVKISANDWTHDFLTTFSNRDIERISYNIDFGAVPEELEKAVAHLDPAEVKCRTHKDKGAVAECREAFEAVKKLDDMFKSKLGANKWGDAVNSANAVKVLGLHTEEREEDLTMDDVEINLNCMINFVAYACRSYERESES